MIVERAVERRVGETGRVDRAALQRRHHLRRRDFDVLCRRRIAAVLIEPRF